MRCPNCEIVQLKVAAARGHYSHQPFWIRLYITEVTENYSFRTVGFAPLSVKAAFNATVGGNL
jgi:hypothetical protein